MLKYFLLFSLLVISTQTAWGQQPSSAVPAACFETLKAEALEIADFATAADELEGLNYQSLESGFSRFYQGRSSFGIDVDSSIFDMRVYSFGQQTGYVHPPYSPFPVGTQSESWKAPAREFIVAEEYVRRPDGERQFLGCGFFRIAGMDLKAITSESYLYDGDLVSIKTQKGSDKLWYNFNDSFNADDERLGYWYRLFVYPKATQNSYFSRYEVFSSFPGNEVSDFSMLSSEGIDARIESGAGFSELEPVVVEGPFFLNNYYQAIVNRFPEFGERLALRGFLEYENLQKVLASPDAAAVNYVWDTVLDARDITTYALKKQKGELAGSDPLYDSVLADPAAVNVELSNLSVSVVESQVEAETKTVNPVASSDGSLFEAPFGTFIMVVLLLVLLFALIGGMLFFTQKNNR